MLTNLHVKNLALIKEADIEFGEGLNILTGETGAGKSIILGSINLALGGKASSDIIGRHGDSAVVELTFSIDDEDKIKTFQEMDIYPEDGRITVFRRIMAGKSVIKVNGETMTAAGVRRITELLLDIHGQHDHQSLLYKNNHLDILDRYAKNELLPVKTELEEAYKEYVKAKKALSEFSIDAEERNRNVSFLTFEIDEITNADVKDGEDVEIETLYRKISNSRKITEELDDVIKCVGNDGISTASDQITRALNAITRALQYDNDIEPLYNELTDIENLLSDFNRDLSSYMNSFEFDERKFIETEARLDTINNLKSKYGGTIESINNYLEEAKAKLAFYEDYENNLARAKEELDCREKEVVRLCEIITTIRKKSAVSLADEIKQALLDLNFNEVKFEIEIRQLETLSKNGSDEAEFMISLNPGEEVKPLAKIASGGELSRIMLGIKSVLAGKDDIETLIFDEIDTGISGRTAQKVSEKMAVIANSHQVICITHLSQIASMADTHFLIEKDYIDGCTETYIKALSEDGMINELARMLGGSQITDIVIESARQMKAMANELKKITD